MNKTFVGFIFLLFLVGGVVSCQRSSSPYPYSLRYADSLMEISPERTLAYLRKLDISTYSAGDRAYFSLLFTQATDKNMLSLQSLFSHIHFFLNPAFIKPSFSQIDTIFFNIII